MNTDKKYIKHLDILRILACVAILLFHLGLIKGGYLAVCLFFTLSGYLCCVKSFRREKFNILKYYKDKFINIYIPVVLVLLVTIYVSKQFPNIAWLNLKLEAKSVLLNYNNFWQISTNVDYFTKSINSPLTHLWYISILLQYEVLFPFVFLFFKTLGKKLSKGLSVFLLTVISILLSLYFVYETINHGIMISYYDSLSRSFSYVFGITLGFIHSFYGVP
ncbi:MAG: acyltransferase, partial [Bacilli bacterium]|nr:acyltransferase [Bacilli bacterium]